MEQQILTRRQSFKRNESDNQTELERWQSNIRESEEKITETAVMKINFNPRQYLVNIYSSTRQAKEIEEH